MTDPIVAAQFDQARVLITAELDHLVEALVTAHSTCDCTGEVDSMNHLVSFAQIYRREYTPDVLAALLIEAVARLALAKEAQ
ncbi:hypothetical protein [Nocardia asteroides]|uniref:hypothetical protein n=1 Tax=Nocardia asteroides TaxID=1824 RepID=UPI0033C38144